MWATPWVFLGPQLCGGVTALKRNRMVICHYLAVNRLHGGTGGEGQVAERPLWHQGGSTEAQSSINGGVPAGEGGQNSGQVSDLASFV